ncbi:hypothetical protein VP01_2389g3 [Puccinia sorghi]|uniref:Uncharacterized protein n=1 Tax=Puccinia sorghi TaxID=27349 RepID=A0A0L6V6T8_9BASI|nr:hypothetical protein VP01_2389g3 [Puccinia sorghi]
MNADRIRNLQVSINTEFLYILLEKWANEFFHKESRSISLKPLDDYVALSPWKCPRFCDFEAESERKKRKEVAEGSMESGEVEGTIVVKLEQMTRFRNHWELPTAMIIGMEQCFQVVLGSIASWTSEPPELVGLALIRGTKAVKILPHHCPRDFAMASGDRIRIRICPPFRNPLRRSISDNSFCCPRTSFPLSQPSRPRLSHLPLPANPRPQRSLSSKSAGES